MTVILFLAINAMFNWPVISLPVVVSEPATRRGHGSRVTTGCASPRKRAGVDGGSDPDPEFCLRTFGDAVPLNMQSTLWETN